MFDMPVCSDVKLPVSSTPSCMLGTQLWRNSSHLPQTERTSADSDQRTALSTVIAFTSSPISQRSLSATLRMFVAEYCEHVFSTRMRCSLDLVSDPFRHVQQA